MKKIKEEYFYTNDEFYSIINDIITNDEFIKTKYIRHHGITRYNHSLRVAYHTFLVTKKLKLNYKEATRAALLHDFFLEETKDMNQHQALRKHPEYALKNAKKYCLRKCSKIISFNRIRKGYNFKTYVSDN